MKRTAKSSFLLPLALLLFGALPARGEGSRELTANGGQRFFLEYRNDFTTGIPRRSIIKVYAEAGEEIFLGSSAVGRGGTINYRAPNGTTGTCGAAGAIADRAQELAGPSALAAGGYNECTITTAQTTAAGDGVWEIDFVSPNPGSVDNPISIGAGFNWTQAGNQPTNVGYVTAWDVTVNDPGGEGEQTGRVFANYLALNPGADDPDIAFEFEPTIVTRDGYQYLVNLNGMQPFGFIFFANKNGFTDAAGIPLYQSVDFPAQTDDPSNFANDDITHKIFFNSPDSTGTNILPLSGNSPQGSTWLLNSPQDPPEPSNLRFVGSEGTVNQTGSNPLEGRFLFNSPEATSFQITIDINDDGIFGNDNDRIIFGFAGIGENSVVWDGLDRDGVPVPPSELGYAADIRLFGGEVHFPFLDVEGNQNGLIIERQNNPPNYDASDPLANPFLVYYDDRNVTPQETAPNPLSALSGIDSSTGAHSFPAGNFTGWGDQRGIDTWARLPSIPVQLAGRIRVLEADLDISKTVVTTNLLVGGPIEYDIVVTNNGPSSVTGARVRDGLPPEIINVSWTCEITTGTGNCAQETGSGNLSTTVDLDSGAQATYRISGGLGPDVGDSVTNIAIVTRPSDVTDPNDQDNSGGTNVTESATAIAEPISPGNAQLGTAKAAGTPVNNGDGTFTIPYTIQVENLGDLPFDTLQIEEDLTTTFAGVTSFTVESGSISSPDGLNVNTDFNGQGNNQLLAGDNSLAVGATVTVQFNVIVTPGTAFGPYENTATATGTTPGGIEVTDDSTDGNDVDPDGDGNPDENDPTVVNLVVPRLGVAKAAGTPVNNGDGTFTIPYTIQVENLGNVPLSNLQVTEDLTTTFSGVSSFSVVSNSIGSPSGLVVNSNFNGQGNNDLLATGNTLAIGETETIEFEVTVTPGTNFGPYENTATGSGSGPDGTEVTDDSTDGNDADPNGDGTPDENDPTTVTLSSQPILGVAKAAGTPVNNGDGTFTIPYTIQVDNLGNVAIEDLQVVENLANTFSGVSSFTVVSNSLTSPSGLVVNSNFNGQGNNNLLATGNTLAVGATATISFEVTVTPGTNFGPYNNTATGSGTGPDGTPVEDDSTDGNDVDPDGDGTPDEDVPTTVSLLAPPDGRANLRLVKRVTAINDRTFIDVVDDPNLDDNAPSWPGNYLQGRIDVPDVFPGDEVEYTIYFMSDGEVSANNVRICDLVPLNQTFVPDGFNGLAQAGGGFGGVNRGVAIAFGLNAPLSYTNANDGDIARFFTPGNFVPVPPGGAAPQPCPAVNNSANGNGAIVIELGDLPSVADDPQRAFGFIRFRATVD
ncbi:DUF11 domain-containing protein [Oxynema sp. CENA135]|uniref:DUF11 domain-containing protein n=1 Tax=Oxynema sp. CENA135 TaxID=984206 RepID=UPI001909CC6A|nr:DUF11 domain-containing protein [Oxynema sp. CENA135]MBK4728936.1 DUF11 domain-containing protein [Oxynema sp. CENA135]